MPAHGAKARMNRLKVREPWRPVAPMVAAEAVARLFEPPPPGLRHSSPYMSFAPRLTAAACRMMPAVCHFDRTARLQTVSAADDLWLNRLLSAVGRRLGGRAVLMNTSFNVKGEPIINRAATSLRLLDAEPELDLVFIDGWLFSKQRPT